VFSGFCILYFNRNVAGWETAMGMSFVGVFLSLVPMKLPAIDHKLSLWIYLAHAPLIQATKDVLPLIGLRWPKSISTEIVGICVFIFILLLLFRGVRKSILARGILLPASS
jgi:hypothetical protein